MARRLTQEMLTSTGRKALAWGGSGALPCKPLRWKHRQSPNPKPRASPVDLVTSAPLFSPGKGRASCLPSATWRGQKGKCPAGGNRSQGNPTRALPSPAVGVCQAPCLGLCVCVCVCGCAHAQDTMTCCLLFFAPVSIGSCFLKWNELKIQMLIEDTYS